MCTNPFSPQISHHADSFEKNRLASGADDRAATGVHRLAGFVRHLIRAGPNFSGNHRLLLLHQEVLDGRLLLLLADNDRSEPRFQISDAAGTQMVFGADVEGWQPGGSQLLDVRAFGYPLERLKDIPAGDCCVQVFAP